MTYPAEMDTDGNTSKASSIYTCTIQNNYSISERYNLLVPTCQSFCSTIALHRKSGERKMNQKEYKLYK